VTNRVTINFYANRMMLSWQLLSKPDAGFGAVIGQSIMIE
jgi:hypothetical protein